MLSRYDPKSLSTWIELDFFRRPGRLRRMRPLVTWACVLAALAVVGISLIPANHSMYEAGPVSPAHVHITECSVCHTPFSPARRHGRATPASPPFRFACVACHNPVRIMPTPGRLAGLFEVAITNTTDRRVAGNAAMPSASVVTRLEVSPAWTRYLATSPASHRVTRNSGCFAKAIRLGTRERFTFGTMFTFAKKACR